MAQRRIIRDAMRRNINHLVHFTCADNIESILENGLLTRECLEYEEMEFDFNDEYRIDEVRDSVSLSVTSPNYKMFYPIRLTHPEKEWVVLKLDAIKVLQLDCAFCYTNAASSEINYIPIDQRRTYEAYLSLFDEEHTEYSRKQLNLSDDEPTNPQAEILVLESIPVEYIEYAFFQNKSVYDKYKHLFYGLQVYPWYDKGIYYGRHDYNFWN